MKIFINTNIKVKNAQFQQYLFLAQRIVRYADCPSFEVHVKRSFVDGISIAQLIHVVCSYMEDVRVTKTSLLVIKNVNNNVEVRLFFLKTY